MSAPTLDGDNTNHGDVLERLNQVLKAAPNALMYGPPAGDGVTDDTIALRTSISAALTGGIWRLPASYIFRITDTLTVPPGIGIDMCGAQILYEGPKDRPALVIGASGTPNQSGTGRQLQFLGLDVRHKINPSAADLSHEDFVGIRFFNLRQCGNVEIAYALGFTRGVEIVADAAGGSAYNKFFWGRLINNRRYLYFRTAGTSGGFVTQNQHFGGSLITTDVYPDLDATGVTTSWDGISSNRESDCQMFDGMCFELGEHGGASDRIPIYHDGAGHNYTYINIRMENCDGPGAIFDGGASLPTQDTYVNNNLVSFSTYSGQHQSEVPIVELGRAVGNRVTGMLTVDSVFGGDLRPRNIPGCVKAGGAAGEKTLTGEWLFMANSAPTPVKNFVSTLVSLKPDYVELAEIGSSIAVGVPVDLSTRKTARVRMNCKLGYEGRLLLMLFDRRGRQLTSAGTGEDLLLGYWNYHNGQAATSLPYSSAFGGSFRNLNKVYGTTVQTFRFADNVHFAIFAVSNNANGDGVVRLINLDIAAPPIGSRDGNDGTGFFLPGIDLNAPPVSSAKPNTGGNTYGDHTRGELVLNSAAAAGVPLGWSCNLTGKIAPVWVLSTAYAVDNVRANGANVYICTTAGTSAGSGGPTGTGTSITDGTAVWDYLAPLATFVTAANLS